MDQIEIIGKGSLGSVKKIIDEFQPHKILLVTGKNSYSQSKARVFLSRILNKYQVIHFCGFAPNPKLKDIERGITLISQDCDLVIAVGGGSVLDMAKAVNILSCQKGKPLDYITGKQRLRNMARPTIAIPTTTGSGSEATRFSVLYIRGKKYTLDNESILPKVAVCDPDLTFSMPKKIAAASSLDALSQAIESYWSIYSNKRSRKFAREAIMIILKNIKKSVLDNNKRARAQMLIASHLAGKAINITKTTAAHALSYPLTIHFGLEHGHAVALNLGRILEYNFKASRQDCNDSRGAAFVKKRIREIVKLLGCREILEARKFLDHLIEELGLENYFSKLGIQEKELKLIAKEVNLERLKNNPRKFKDTKDIVELLKA